jgi:YfiH family protein
MKIFFGSKSNSILDGKYLSQVHSNKVVVVTDKFQITDNFEADALVTKLRGIKLSVKTADCVPILLSSHNAVAAVHAGWRGAYNGIIQNTVDIMKQFGVLDIEAYIGPSIRQEHYEVDEKFYKKFISQSEENKRFFNNLHFDLPGYCKSILIGCEVINISDEGIDTYSNPDKFYSYRYYSKHGLILEKEQRQISSIEL